MGGTLYGSQRATPLRPMGRIRANLRLPGGPRTVRIDFLLRRKSPCGEVPCCNDRSDALPGQHSSYRQEAQKHKPQRMGFSAACDLKNCGLCSGWSEALAEPL